MENSQNLFTIEVTWTVIGWSILSLLLLLFGVIKFFRHWLRHRIIFERSEVEKPVVKIREEYQKVNNYLIEILSIKPLDSSGIEEKINEITNGAKACLAGLLKLDYSPWHNNNYVETVLRHLEDAYFVSFVLKLHEMNNADFSLLSSFRHDILKKWESLLTKDERHKIKSCVERNIRFLPLSELREFKFDHLAGIDVSEMEKYRQNILEKNTLHELKDLTKNLNDLRIIGEADGFLALAAKTIDFLKNNEIRDKESFTREAFKIKNCLLDEINYYKAKSEKSDDAMKLTILFNYREWLTGKIEQIETEKQEPVALVTEKTE